MIGTHDEGAYDPAEVSASHDLLLLSSSIPATRHGGALCPDDDTSDLLGATAAGGDAVGTLGGHTPGAIYIRIVDADHPITAGLPVDERLRVVRQADTFSVAWPFRGPGVQVLAKHLFGGDSALLVAEVGAELSNGQPAQARTVFLFWHHDTFYLSTGEAVQLFDRAVDWALGLPSGDGA